MNWRQIFQEYFFKVEPEVSGVRGDYKGSSFEALYTSTDDFTTIFSEVKSIGTFADLGAGMGQGCLIYASLFPDAKSIAVEFSSARVKAGREIANSHGLHNIEFREADLLIAPLPHADTYFLYFPTGPVLDKIVYELLEKEKFQLIVIESHGDLFARLNKEERLELLQEIPLKDPRHAGVARVFGKRLSLHEFSFLERYLLIHDESGEEWLGESFGLEWAHDDQFNLEVPPRTIGISQVRSVKKRGEFSAEIAEVLQLRRAGTVRIQTQTSSLTGLIRKIFISPRFKLELSSGEQVEWSDITDISTELSCQKLS